MLRVISHLRGLCPGRSGIGIISFPISRLPLHRKGSRSRASVPAVRTSGLWSPGFSLLLVLLVLFFFLLPLPYFSVLSSPSHPSPPPLSSSHAHGFFTLAHLTHLQSLSAASAAFRPLSPPRADSRRLATPPEEAWSHPREADPTPREHPEVQYFPSRHAARGHRSRVRKQWPPTPEPPPQHRSR